VQAAIFRLAPVPHTRSTLLIPPGDLLVVHWPSLPPPTLGERRHRRLARRLVASARAYVGFVRANVAEYDIAEVSSLARQARDPSVKNVRVAVLRASD